MKKKLSCVLLIEDDKATNLLNKMVISKAGIADRIEVALNGKEALDYLSGTGNYEHNEEHFYQQPALILLDINMPVMDGWDFMESYKKLPDDKKGKAIIVMLTSSSDPNDIDRASKINEIANFKNKLLTPVLLEEIMKEHFKVNFNPYSGIMCKFSPEEL